MRTLTIALVACGALLLTAACGDDDGGTNDNNVNINDNGNDNGNANQNNNNTTIDPFTGTLDELDGYYELTSATLRPSAVEIPLTTEDTSVQLPEFGGTTARVRGYADLASTSASDGQVQLRWGVIADAFTMGDVGYYIVDYDFTATWEQADGKLVLDDGNVTGVYLVEYSAGVLTLHYDDSDWRSNISHIRNGVRLELTEATPTTTPLDGVWNTGEATFNTGETDEYIRHPGCFLIDPDDGITGVSCLRTGNMTIGPAGFVIFDTLLETFDSTDCTGTYIDHFTGDSYGFIDVDTGTGTIDYYMYHPDGDNNESGQTWGYTHDATVLTQTFMDYRRSTPVTWNGEDSNTWTEAP